MMHFLTKHVFCIIYCTVGTSKGGARGRVGTADAEQQKELLLWVLEVCEYSEQNRLNRELRNL